jgi:hypothetical protein
MYTKHVPTVAELLRTPWIVGKYLSHYDAADVGAGFSADIG